ncbi:MAG TPA: acetyl-CoA carboxylase biotin carboxyl carrier protein [Candidatus Eisenbacteria bacterium]|nr:acetyl-CoA carboxylase biotin carboxyl carrier protein [Candidatus Eisenbacteria bacterium]
MNLRRKIREMVAIMREEELAELEVRRWFTSVRVRRPGMDGTMPARQAQTTEAHGGAESREEVDAKPPKNLVPIKSPMVGTFYRAPAPDADPYVEENSSITVGQTVCIVEAMKLMNEIESEVEGRIARILVENAQPVEYGQTLFLVESDTAA